MSDGPKYGVQTATAPKCKICQHPQRADIEDVLYLSKNKLLMEDGVRPTQAWLNSDKAEARWGIRVNSVNIEGHWKNHFRQGDPKEMQEMVVRDLRTKLEQHIKEKGIRPVGVDEFLNAIVSIGFARAELDPGSITVDQAIKASAELTKRRSDESRHQLLQELVKAQAGADGGVIEAEAVEVAEIGSGA